MATPGALMSSKVDIGASTGVSSPLTFRLSVYDPVSTPGSRARAINKLL